MFQEIIEFLKSCWRELVPIVTIDCWEGALILRFGKVSRVLPPGWYWKIPLIEKAVIHSVVTTTMPLVSQTITTKDRVELVTEGVVKYRISDLKKYCTEIWDSVDALGDLCAGTICKQISNHTYEQCLNTDLNNKITCEARNQVKKYGIEIETVTLTTIAKVRSIRLIGLRTKHIEV